MKIKPEELSQALLNEDYDTLFSHTRNISSWICKQGFRIYEPNLIDDISQDTSIRLWKGIQTGSVQPTNTLFGLISKMAHYTCLDYLRRKKTYNNRFIPLDITEQHL